MAKSRGGGGGGGGRGTPYIWMIGMIVIFFRGCDQQFSFLGVVQVKSTKKIKLVFVRV